VKISKASFSKNEIIKLITDTLWAYDYLLNESIKNVVFFTL
jgi:hypothetical protein